MSGITTYHNVFLFPYSHGFNSHGLGSWVAHTVARGLIYRLVWVLTTGMGPAVLLGLVLVALAVVWMMRRA